MTMRVAKSKEDFAAIVAGELFEDMRKQIHDLDNQMEEQGVDAADFLMLVFAKLSFACASYTSYMTAGLMLCTEGADADTGRMKQALRNDIDVAVDSGVELARRKAVSITEEIDATKADIAAKLDDIVKKCH